MLSVDIALGVAGGLLLFALGKGLLELPGQIAARKQHERHHREFIQTMVEVGDRAVAAAQEAQAKKKPARRKPATKKAPAKKGATNVKAKARR